MVEGENISKTRGSLLTLGDRHEELLNQIDEIATTTKRKFNLLGRSIYQQQISIYFQIRSNKKLQRF